MTIDLTAQIDTSDIGPDATTIDTTDILTPLGDIQTILENILNGAQDAEAIRFIEGSAPTTPASGKWKLYFKATGLFVIDDAGTEYGPLMIPSDIPFIVKTATGFLSAEQALGALGTGLLKNATGTGTLSIATASIDYQAPVLVTHIADIKAQNTAQTTYSADSWQKVDLTTTVSDGGFTSLASSVIAIGGPRTLILHANMRVRMAGTGGHVAIRLRDTTTPVTLAQSMWQYIPANEWKNINLYGKTVLASGAPNVELQIYPTEATSATNSAANVASESERYADVFIESIVG